MNDKNIIFHVEGGIGKNIMATAVAKAIKKKNPDRDIITISSWPAIWFNNPNVERFYQLGNTPYIFEDYIRDKDTLIMKQEPYHHHGYINKKVHCIQAFVRLFDEWVTRVAWSVAALSAASASYVHGRGGGQGPEV